MNIRSCDETHRRVRDVERRNVCVFTAHQRRLSSKKNALELYIYKYIYTCISDTIGSLAQGGNAICCVESGAALWGSMSHTGALGGRRTRFDEVKGFKLSEGDEVCREPLGSDGSSCVYGGMLPCLMGRLRDGGGVEMFALV